MEGASETPSQKGATTGHLILWALVFTAVAALFLSQHQEGALVLMLPLMLWAATRFPTLWFALALGLCGIAGLGTIQQTTGSITSGHSLALHILLLTMLGVSLYVRLLLGYRARLAADLEQAVGERTRELKVRNQELTDEIYVREQAERSFRRSTRHYRALLETTSNPIILLDREFRVSQWNGAAEELFGYSRDDAVGRNFIQSFIPTSHQDEFAWKITKIRSSTLWRESIEIAVADFSGETHTVLWNINRLEGEDDFEQNALILIGQDISEIRETQDRLHFLAHYDTLTGTANRRLFEDRCEQAMARCQRYGHSCALITLDIDHFKRINDTLGHDAGDELLKEMARRLRGAVRGEDTIARLGGDEFAVLLNQVKGPDGCEKVARNILASLTRPVSVQQGELVITSSLGITVAPQDGFNYETLLKNADMAMYRAKNAGRNNIQFFDQSMNHEIQKQLQIEQELGDAVRDELLDLYYQPIVDLERGQIHGLEGLLRWHHSEDGLRTPAAFLQVAEQTGQLLEIGEWVYYNACLQARAIQAVHERPTPVSINLSARQYHHPMLIDQLTRIIDDTGIEPSLLSIEVDEAILAERLEDAMNVLGRLNKLGVKLVLDRFGRGLSSVRFLRDLPFEQVKIDRSLISDIPEGRNSCAIVRTLVTLAREMELTVIASGVESDEQLRFLHSINCQLVQGHRLCSPVPSSELADLFRRTRGGHSFHAGIQYDLLSTTESEGDI